MNVGYALLFACKQTVCDQAVRRQRCSLFRLVFVIWRYVAVVSMMVDYHNDWK